MQRKYLKPLWIASALGAMVFSHVPPAAASTITAQLTSCFLSTGCGAAGTSYGTVTVTSVSSIEVNVSLALTGSEVFATSGAGKPLVFDISGNPPTSVTFVSTPTANGTSSGNPDGFGFSQAPPVIMADGTGTWNDAITCASCSTGTNGMVSGTLSFNVTVAGGITPASFVQNGHSLYFATDIGIPTGTPGSYNTGDVGATTVSAVPLPAGVWLLVCALGGLSAFSRKRRTA